MTSATVPRANSWPASARLCGPPGEPAGKRAWWGSHPSCQEAARCSLSHLKPGFWLSRKQSPMKTVDRHGLTPVSSQAPRSRSLTPPTPALLPVGWGGELGKKVELAGWDKNSLITKVKYNLTIIIMKHHNNSNEKEYNKKKRKRGKKTKKSQ